MREINTHKANGLNEAIKVLALDPPGAGGANHVYELSGAGPTVRIEFHDGRATYPYPGAFNGLSNESLLAVVADRLEGFQSGPFACKDNEDALAMIKGGLTCLLKRTKKRVEQGIEGANVQHAETSAVTAGSPASLTDVGSTDATPTAGTPATPVVTAGSPFQDVSGR